MKKLVQSIVPFSVFFLTVSSWKITGQDWLLVAICGLLIGYAIFKKIKIDNSFILILVFWFYVNLLAFLYFKESLNSNLPVLIGSVMRLVIGYLLIKAGGINTFFKGEKISFNILLISFPIFLMIEFIPGAESFFKHFDVGAVNAQAADGGWNMIVFAKNPWHVFQFQGYAWEPGAMALIIVFSLILSILRDGLKIDFRKCYYLILLVFTFSTAGYLALIFIMLFYLLQYGMKPQYLAIFILTIPLLLPVLSFVYKQDFMSKKIAWYFDNSEKNRSRGYEKISQDNLSRYDYIFLAGELISKWPVGYGVSEKEIPKTRAHNALKGPNSLISVLVVWGIVGFIYMLMMINKFLKDQAWYYGISRYNLLFFALLIVLFSNPIERSPLFYGIIFYPFIYGTEIKNAFYAELTTEEYEI